MIYDPKSKCADEFINDAEIRRCLEYAKTPKPESFYLDILEKAKLEQGLNHEEVACLLTCNDENIWKEIFSLARKIKKAYYGNRIVLFAPLYLSNYCINGCVYCPYHAKNKTIARKKLSQEDIKNETIALMDMGHKRLALEMGEDDKINTMEYLLESIKNIYSIKHENGSIRRVNVNIAATTHENYRKLKEAGIGTYILFQETYNKENYEILHPTGPKHNYNYHTEAMDRAMEAGIDDVGIGVLFGLNTYEYELVGIMMHKEHLEARFGVGPHTISVPRICPADDIDTNDFENALSDDIFIKIVALLRISVPYTGMIISTRESKESREKALQVGISQISGGSKTSVGGYYEPVQEETSQFDVSDNRSLDEVVGWLLDMDHIPSFCTACYRAGRTGDRFMSLCKNKQIGNICGPNALLTLQEYLEDYASASTKAKGEAVISKTISLIENEKIRNQTISYLKEIKNGKRDFRF